MSGEDDLLERATRALRAAPPPSEEELRVERAVLLRALRTASQHKASKSRVLRWVLPLAAVLTAGSALAASTGQIERAVQVMSEWLGGERAADGPSEAKPRARKVRSREQPARDRPAPATTVAPAPQQPPEPTVSPAPALSPAPAPAPAPALVPVRAPRNTVGKSERKQGADAPAGREDASASSPATDGEPSAAAEAVEPTKTINPDLARYREAHRMHFRERDFWAALRAWESYLSSYPEGTFAVEARYNRAICLVRLGRKEEARRALAPFASGEVARGYRKTEASELLEALE
jgi:TolA-binding protein